MTVLTQSTFKKKWFHTHWKYLHECLMSPKRMILTSSYLSEKWNILYFLEFLFRIDTYSTWQIKNIREKYPWKVVSSNHIIPITGNAAFWNYKPKQSFKSKMLKKFSELLENAFETMKEPNKHLNGRFCPHPRFELYKLCSMTHSYAAWVFKCWKSTRHLRRKWKIN